MARPVPSAAGVAERFHFHDLYMARSVSACYYQLSCQ